MTLLMEEGGVEEARRNAEEADDERADDMGAAKMVGLGVP